MNRREFLKGTLGGVFGAFLTWAGAVRVEEAEPTVLSDNEKRQAVEDRLAYEARAALEQMPETVTADQAFDAIVDSVNKWNDRISDSVGWDYNPETGGAYPAWASRDGKWDYAEVANYDWPEYAPEPVSYADGTPLKAAPDSTTVEPWEGGYIRSRTDGRFVHWDNRSGSDENGEGTYDDPVATEACARSIADNQHRRDTTEMLAHDGICGVLLARGGSAFVSGDMGATWCEMDPAQVQKWVDLG